jgi:hypothetical protein
VVARQITATTTLQTVVPPSDEKATETYAHQGKIGASKGRTGPTMHALIFHQQRKAGHKGEHSDPVYGI